MLSQKNRLRKSEEITRVQKYGRAVFTQNIRLKYASSQNNTTRVAFITSTKISKKAVIRNKIRRWMREGVRKEVDSIKPNVDIIFSALPLSKNADHKIIHQNIKYLLSKARLISK